MQFRKAISELAGLQYLSEDLVFCSPMGRNFLMETAMCFSESQLNAEFDLIERVMDAYGNHPQTMSKLQHKLAQLRDIRGTVRNLANDLVLDDVELFEIKSFSMICAEIVVLQQQLDNAIVRLPDMADLVKKLDPQNSGIPSFYIYDEYAPELAELRKKLRLAQSVNGEENQNGEVILSQAQELEAEIRAQLCADIKIFADDLAMALQVLAHLDLLMAKANQAMRLGFCRPNFSLGNTHYKALFNPLVKSELAKQNKPYQGIDIELSKSVCLITGANMAGKTVLLKSLALCQYLCQFGFYVPAKSAQICLVDQILISIGDDQSELNGLSSFASEMIQVSRMIELANANSNVMILIDELARTTNPVEGLAIVNAVAEILYQKGIRSLITTHYSGLNSCFRNLRVKGLDKDLEGRKITKENINSYMDYSLVEDNSGEVPHEALRIASLLGVNEELIEKAQDQLASKNKL